MRRSEIEDFVTLAGWQEAETTPLAGDASRRRYFRLVKPATNERAVLMDAPLDSGEDVQPFVKIASYLRSVGLSAPEVLQARADRGLLLLEDLGDNLFARAVVVQPELEITLYQAATDVLIQLHQEEPPTELSTYTPEVMAEQSALILDWYLPSLSISVSSQIQHDFRDSLSTLLSKHAATADVMVQRDYHSDQVTIANSRSALKRVGLLDFQDATLGHRMYDLVSLLQDARRDVPVQIETAMQRHYIEATDASLDESKTAYAVLGAQRALRILGVFARLALRDGKPHYLDLMPRVWDLLKRNLAHTALTDLNQVITDLIPEPTDAIKTTLRQKCATIPKLS